MLFSVNSGRINPIQDLSSTFALLAEAELTEPTVKMGNAEFCNTLLFPGVFKTPVRNWENLAKQRLSWHRKTAKVEVRGVRIAAFAPLHDGQLN